MKEQLEQYVKKVKELHEICRGNEAITKASLIAPLFGILGFDMSDPHECVPEYRVDFGKGEKAATPVDWAFALNSAFVFLVEAKEAGKKLKSYAEQLGMYFAKAAVKLGIYSNGVQWQFYSDVTKDNIMDTAPFLTWDILNDDPLPLDFLTILHKSQFKPQLIQTFAKRGRRTNLLVDELAKLLAPSPEFVKLAVKNIENRNLTANIIEEWTPILKNAIYEWAKQKALSMALERPADTDRKQAEQGGRKRPMKGRKDDGPKLADVIAAGLLVPPVTVSRKYKGKVLEATIMPDGAVEFAGTRHATCSAAAEMARSTITGRRMSTNGWNFWQWLDPDGKKGTLADLRRRFKAMKSGTAESS